MNTYEPSDIEVLRGSQGSPWMFGLLVDRYQEAFLRKGTYILHSPQAAEDAVQETFLKIYKYADKFTERENASFHSWAYKILTNTCYTHLAKKAKTEERERGMEFAELDVAGSRETSGREEASFVQSVLTRLPAKFSRLLTLYFFEDKSYEEIALEENISLSAVKSGLHRAKKQFKEVAITLS